MNIPRISLITVTKNDPAGLTRTVVSANRWRELGVEHVVVDGGDDLAATERVLAGVAGEIRLVRRSPYGIADAFNAGLAETHGEWVWFLNGGDGVHEQLRPEWLLDLLANTSADMVIGSVHYDNETRPRSAPPMAEQWPVLNNWLPHPSTIVRRSLIRSVGEFDTSLQVAMDFDLWQRVLRRERVADVVSIPFARFDVTGISQQATLRSAVRYENARVVWRHAVRHAADCWWLMRQWARAMLRTVYWKIRPHVRPR